LTPKDSKDDKQAVLRLETNEWFVTSKKVEAIIPTRREGDVARGMRKARTRIYMKK